MGERLKDRTASVIGAARGIGAGSAERLLEAGARVVIADADVAARDTAARLGAIGPTFAVELDISEKAGAETAVGAALQRFGRVDILVQNAGIYPWTLIEDISPEEWDR